MLPGTTQPEYVRPLQQYGRLNSQQGTRPAYYGSAHRPTIELPRPLEPRPIHHLQSSLSEASGTQRHLDAFRGPSTALQDYRTQGHSLPGLRDILTPNPSSIGQPSYSTAWPTNTAPAPAPAAVSNDSYHRRNEWHPPLVLPANPSYQAPSTHQLELPILQTSPVPRPPPQSVPVSPYNGYPEARDYAEARSERVRQASTTSYLTNSAPSPYASGPEDTPYRNATTNHDRSQTAAPPPVAPESQRKYLGVKDVHGEGSYHLYEGGFRIPTQVDGESVNPAWGLTKANKPRKRLALACLDCREKKIKCEPGANSCLQCEKAKRPCRRAPAHQAQNEATAASPWQGSPDSPVRTKGISDPNPQSSREPDADSANKRRSREDSSPPNVPQKKHRSASPVITTVNHIAAPGGQSTAAVSPVAVQATTESSQKALVWEEDPYAVEPEVVLHLIDLYFAHVNNATHCLFPRNAFMHWLRTCHDKCQAERMVLYAMLALGSVFADDHLSGFGKHCARIATNAVSGQIGNHVLCSVQARLLIALYHFAKGSYGAAWDWSGCAIRASTSAALRLNTEEGCKDDSDSRSHHRYEFFLSPEQMAECKRRTFWACFLMDLYDKGTTCAIALQDIFLRLPCTDEAYERGLLSDAPYYNNGIIDPASTIITPSSPVCPMARLALIAAIWSDVLNFTNRAVHRPDSTYRQAYEAQYAETHNQLQGWSSRLPDYLRYSEANLDRSIQSGYVGAFIAMHVLYNLILIRMNRYVRHAQMPGLTSRNIRAAHYHAHALLTVMGAVRNARREIVDPGNGRRSEFVLAIPSAGYAIMSAIDVVGAGGLDSNIGTALEVMNGGLDCLRELAKFWTSARDQLRDCERRYYQIHNIISCPFKAKNGAWLGREWGTKDPLEREFGLEHDVIYASDGDGDGYSPHYFDALREKVHDGRSPAGGLRIA